MEKELKNLNKNHKIALFNTSSALSSFLEAQQEKLEQFSETSKYLKDTIAELIKKLNHVTEELR